MPIANPQIKSIATVLTAVTTRVKASALVVRKDSTIEAGLRIR